MRKLDGSTAMTVVGVTAEQPAGGAVVGIEPAGHADGRRRDALVPAAGTAAGGQLSGSIPLRSAPWPTFQHYINNRNFDLNPKDGDGVCAKQKPETGECPNVGDLSAERIIFIGAHDSPVGTPLLVVSNATSGSATSL